jgi:hypothetical protein
MMNSGAGSVALNAAVYGGSRDAELFTCFENGFVQWLALPLVVLAKVDPQHPCWKLLFHGLCSVETDATRDFTAEVS